MPNGSSDPVWTELGHIDYFLEQLARAVERGEVELATYETLAPRYLERRAELASVLQSRRAAASPAAEVPRPVSAQAQVSSAGVPSVRATSLTQPPAAHRAAAIAPPQPVSRQPIQVNWTGVLTAVGALLVIVASAIFAIATWESFSVGFRIGFLGLLTAGFYVAGSLVRTRLRLPAGGVALLVVGSAMLLFDGWIVIDGYQLSGSWPWVAWLTVCSAVYWLTEVRVAGRFFGAIGAAAQIAWVWLLGQGLGWTTAPRAAGVAIVALAWTLAGRLAEDREPLKSLSWIMRMAGPVVVVLAAITVAVDLGIGPAGWPEVFSALVVGACATVIADLVKLPSGIAAVTHLPAFAAIASMIDHTGAGWGHIVVLALMAFAYLIHEVVRGGWGHGILALLAEAGAWWALSLRYEWSSDVTVAVLAAVALSWLVAATLIGRSEDIKWRGTRTTYAVAAVGGYALLAAATIAMPLARMALPLAGTSLVGRDVALAAFMLAVWWAVTLLRDESGAGVFALAGVFYVTAALMGWLAPEWHSALYASVLLGVTGGALVVRGKLAPLLKLPPAELAVGMRLLAAAIVAAGLVASELFFDIRSWETPVLLAVAAVFWMVDALLAEEDRLGLGISSAAAVSAVALLVWWMKAPGFGSSEAAIAGAAAAALLAGSALPLRRRKGWRDAWPVGAAAMGTLGCIPTIDDAGALAIALGLAALAWVPISIVVLPEAAAASGVLAVGALLAALAHFDGPSWTTVAVLVALAGALLAPSLLRFGGLTDRAARMVRSLAAAGFAPLVSLLLIGAQDRVGLDAGQWARIGEQGLVVSLFVVGAYAVAVGLLYRIEPAVFAGGIAFVAATWVELGALDVGLIAAFTTPLALYFVWAGSRWSHSAGQPPAPGFDVIAAIVGLIPPSLAAVSGAFAGPAVAELMWALGLALIAIVCGVLLKVRAYFFGGSLALVFVAVGRSWVYLVELWWLVLGLIGIAMLVIAIAWARQQMLPGDTRQRVAETFEGWR